MIEHTMLFTDLRTDGNNDRTRHVIYRFKDWTETMIEHAMLLTDIKTERKQW